MPSGRLFSLCLLCLALVGCCCLPAGYSQNVSLICEAVVVLMRIARYLFYLILLNSYPYARVLDGPPWSV